MCNHSVRWGLSALEELSWLCSNPRGESPSADQLHWPPQQGSIYTHPAGSFPTPDKVKLILTGWALTFCPSIATRQTSWGDWSPFHAWSQPWHGWGQSQVTSLPEHMPHNHVVLWDVQPVGACSIHTNHQSYCISLLLKFCNIFTFVDFSNKGEVPCVFLALRTLSKTCYWRGCNESRRNAGCKVLAATCCAPGCWKQEGISLLWEHNHHPQTLPNRSRHSCFTAQEKQCIH